MLHETCRRIQGIQGIQGKSTEVALTPTVWTIHQQIFSLPLLPKAKRSVGNKESGLDMLDPKIKLR